MNNEPQLFTGIRSKLVLTQGDMTVEWFRRDDGEMALVCTRHTPDTSWLFCKSNASSEILKAKGILPTFSKVNGLSPGAAADLMRNFLAEALREEKQWKELNNE